MENLIKGFICCAVLVVFWCMPVTSKAATSAIGLHALVIGNADYESAASLRNPINDARSVRDSLKKLGFDVIYGENLSREATLQTIRDFFDSAPKMKVGAFYYAGHGIQINNQNFMIPVDANFGANPDLDANVVSINDLLRYIDERSEAGLVFLDACRDNPFRDQIKSGLTKGTIRATRSMGEINLERGFERAKKPNESALDQSAVDVGVGLAEMDLGVGMLLAYATSPGNVAADGSGLHSPFTEGLVRFIQNPQLEIRQVLSRVRGHVVDTTKGSQLPWDHSSLRTDIFLARLTAPAQTGDQPQKGKETPKLPQAVKPPAQTQQKSVILP